MKVNKAEKNDQWGDASVKRFCHPVKPVWGRVSWAFSIVGMLTFLVFSTFSAAVYAQVSGLGPAKNFELSLSPLEASRGGEAVATLAMLVAPHHLIYHHSVSLKADAQKLDVGWPTPVEKPDPFEGTMVKVFPGGEHLFSIRFPLASGTGMATLTVDYQGCSTSTCFMPTRERFPLLFPTASTGVEPGVGITSPTASGTGGQSSTAAVRAVSTPSGQTDFGRLISEHGIFWALVIAFAGGILVSLTPCVYPMIPITLSIIGGRRENTSLMRGFMLSVTYVAGLSMSYALLGLLVASFGAQIRGILQGATFQLVMAGIFALLALSMFDLFMIEAPAFLRQRLAGAQGSGPGGVFFLGMLSGLMASPCVAAPLAGILAFIAASGSLALGFLMLLSFAWGMGLLLIVIGTFSGAVQSLPRAGEWMNRVKEFYGFLLAGAALYFARPVIGAPWGDLGIALLLASFAAFLGLFAPPPADERLGPRVFKAWGVVTLVVACVFAVSAVANWGGTRLPLGTSVTPAPLAASEGNGMMWYDRLDDAMKAAKAERKLIFVDFRADWCTICREMEAHVFPDPTVLPWLNRMTLLKVDCTTNEGEPAALMKRFGVIGLPTLLILDADGQERPEFRQIGGTDPKGLLAILRQALR